MKRLQTFTAKIAEDAEKSVFSCLFARQGTVHFGLFHWRFASAREVSEEPYNVLFIVVARNLVGFAKEATRHSCGSRNPVSTKLPWIPACAGMREEALATVSILDCHMWPIGFYFWQWAQNISSLCDLRVLCGESSPVIGHQISTIGRVRETLGP
jgi:hypothetical protein